MEKRSEDYVLAHKIRILGHQKNALFTEILLIPYLSVDIYSLYRYYYFRYDV